MTLSPVVIVGQADDAHVVGMSRRVRAFGAEPLLLDPTRFPASLRLTLGEALDDVIIDGTHVRPAAVYVRNVGGGALQAARGAECDSAAERFQNWLVGRERADVLTAIISRWEHIGVPVYNGLAMSPRMTKPFQLALLKEAGLPVPATRWTNDASEVCSFAAGARVAYKPVSGGAATRELGEDDLTPSRLDLLSRAPVTFQSLLPGEDIRVYVLDGEVIAAIQIVSRALDFRGNEERCVRIELPNVRAGAVHSRCAGHRPALHGPGLEARRRRHVALSGAEQLADVPGLRCARRHRRRRLPCGPPGESTARICSRYRTSRGR